ncbi:MAG: hypothetical protein JWN56_1843 [Sphingobacteriales bacterium]|nr:hypothetical protein [Sphingobacteriales bacterium]
MRIRLITTITLLLLSCNFTYGQKKFKVEVKETGTWRDIYCLIDEQGKVIRQLDTSKYYVSFNNDQYAYFAVFGKKGSSGWTAIDANENELFKVYNTSFGEPSPDYLIENKIRIVDVNENIGFANNKGEIIIKPQFKIATSFHKGKAIIGQTCKKVPWDAHAKESDCHHYSIICEKHGYINEKGDLLKIGNYSFDMIMKEIDWKMPDE